MDEHPYSLHLDSLEPSGSPLRQLVEHSLSVIEQTYERFAEDEVALAFNGGKDSVVLLYLIHVKLYERHARKLKQLGIPAETAQWPRLRAIYFLQPNSFPEVTDFMHEMGREYNLDVFITHKSFKDGLAELASGVTLDSGASWPPLKAVFMGTRRTDPHGATLKEFTPTDPGWPPIMRVNPILDWQYSDVWEFIRRLNLKYCSLYDRGYTSIGSVDDTTPNEHLFDEKTKSYRPAYELKDGTLERAGRLKCKESQSQHKR